MTPDQLAAKIDGIVEDAEKLFGNQVARTQTSLFEQIQLLLKRLELNNDGTIKQSQANRAILAKSEQYLDKALRNSGYYESLNRLPDIIITITENSADYFDTILSAFTPDAQYIKNLQRQTISQVETLLANDGLKVMLKEPIKNILNQNINTGASYADLLSQLRTFIMGSSDREGQLLRYSRQIVTDTLFNYSRAFQEAISTSSGLEFVAYVGGLVKDSREFCIERAGQYYHKKEVEEWASLDWQGKRTGTTASTIFVYAAGYNCRHIIVYVSEAVVPSSVIERAKQLGYYHS